MSEFGGSSEIQRPASQQLKEEVDVFTKKYGRLLKGDFRRAIDMKTLFIDLEKFDFSLFGSDKAELTSIVTSETLDSPYSCVTLNIYKDGSPFVPVDLLDQGEEDNAVQVFIGGEGRPFSVHLESFHRNHSGYEEHYLRSLFDAKEQPNYLEESQCRQLILAIQRVDQRFGLEG